MNKSYSVYVSKEAIEDNWTDGEVGPRHALLCNEFYGKEDTLEKAILEAAEWAIGEKVAMSDFSLVEGSNQIIYARTENENGETPSQQELDDWHAGEINLYTAEYYFRVELNETVTDEEFKKLGLSD